MRDTNSRFQLSLANWEIFFLHPRKEKGLFSFFSLCVSFVVCVSLILERIKRDSAFLFSVPRFPEALCVLGGSQASPVCPGKRWRWMWSNGGMILTVKPKYSEKPLSRYHVVHHKSHMDWPGIEPGTPRWEGRSVCVMLTFYITIRFRRHMRQQPNLCTRVCYRQGRLPVSKIWA